MIFLHGVTESNYKIPRSERVDESTQKVRRNHLRKHASLNRKRPNFHLHPKNLRRKYPNNLSSSKNAQDAKRSKWNSFEGRMGPRDERGIRERINNIAGICARIMCQALGGVSSWFFRLCLVLSSRSIHDLCQQNPAKSHRRRSVLLFAHWFDIVGVPFMDVEIFPDKGNE